MFINKAIQKGMNVYIDASENDFGTQMDVSLLVLEQGEQFCFNSETDETAILILEGEVSFNYDDQTVNAARKDTFRFEPWCLLISKSTKATIKATAHSELYIQSTKNDKLFPAVMFKDTDVQVQHAGANGELMGCMRREIKTIFDYENAPFSNMVLGEVLNLPGKWSSYPPHHHPQPEVYFHRFDKPQGFGVSFANGEIYKSQHNGLTVITDGFHSQGTAPGYAMCYVWGIRHLDGNPWEKTRIDDPEHSWLWEQDANNHILNL